MKNTIVRDLFFVFLFTIVINKINCDLPVHCLAKSIEGYWLIHMSNNDGDHNLKCGHEHPDKNLDHLNIFPEKSHNFIQKFETLIQLERPNIVYSVKKNKKQDSSIIDSFNNDDKEKIGTWTMVYDEGVEIRLGDKVFFAFSRYIQTNQFTATNTDTEDTPGYKSQCDKTFLGWYRNSDNYNWGCYWAEKVDSASNFNVEDIDYKNILSISKIERKHEKRASIIKHKTQKFLESEKQKKTEEYEKSTLNSGSTPNYVDFLKSLMNNNNDDSMSSVPHLDIYFLNNNQEEESSSNFLEENISISLKSKEKVFQPDMSYVNKVNDPKNNYKWEATVYPEFIGKSYTSMRSLLGNVNSLKSMIQDVPEPESPQFIELDMDMNLNNSSTSKNNELPASFTWTNVDGVNYDSPIKKQGECGSCYALAVLSVFETRLRIKSNNRNKAILSSSSVIGCSRLNQGCSGGYPFLVGKHGVEFGFVEESCQPYQEDDKTCKLLCFEEKTYKASNYGYVGGYYGSCSEEKMMEEIYNNGPIVVAINATPELYYYKSGIFHSEAIKKEGTLEKSVKPWEYTNHAVVAVGWGEEYVKDTLEKFWILKNSWGDTWGEKGYFKLTKGTNMASVEAQAVFVNPV